jgi:hypothetical protein
VIRHGLKFLIQIEALKNNKSLSPIPNDNNKKRERYNYARAFEVFWVVLVARDAPIHGRPDPHTLVSSTARCSLASPLCMDREMLYVWLHPIPSLSVFCVAIVTAKIVVRICTE